MSAKQFLLFFSFVCVQIWRNVPIRISSHWYSGVIYPIYISRSTRSLPCQCKHHKTTWARVAFELIYVNAERYLLSVLGAVHGKNAAGADVFRLVNFQPMLPIDGHPHFMSYAILQLLDVLFNMLFCLRCRHTALESDMILEYSQRLLNV